jgi:hypothetical protein
MRGVGRLRIIRISLAFMASGALMWLLVRSSEQLEMTSQMFSIVASLTTIFALAGVAYSLAMQAKANSISAHVSAAERISSLANAALDDGELLVCWQSSTLP